MTVKADAAARVFEARTTGIRWAVLDTGIDARHPAFKRAGKAGGAGRASRTRAGRRTKYTSRVIKTYDFLRIKALLDPDAEVDDRSVGGRRREAEAGPRPS